MSCVVELQDAFEDAVKFFGESSKTMPPSVFFPIFVRFIKAYRVSAMKWAWPVDRKPLPHFVTSGGSLN